MIGCLGRVEPLSNGGNVQSAELEPWQSDGHAARRTARPWILKTALDDLDHESARSDVVAYHPDRGASFRRV